MRDWDLMRVLLEVARTGSFRKGAEALGLTQPTIGKKIDQLEGIVRAQIFIRTKSGVSLTPVGRMLVNVAEEMERAADTAVSEVENALRSPSGRVRVAMTDGMAGYWLAPRMHRFMSENPNITLEIESVDSMREIDLSSREADISVMYSFPTDPDVVVLGESNLVLAPFCTDEFIERWGRPNSLEDVLNFPVLTHTMHHLAIGELKPWAEMLQRHTMIALRTASSMVLGVYAMRGLGISLQPVGVLDREAGVQMLDLDNFRCGLPFFLVCHKEVKDIPSVRTAIEYLQAFLFEEDAAGSPARKLDWKINW